MPFKFHGGVHPNYMKAPDVPVTVIAPPPQVVLPVMQHIGAPCKPLVEVGDYVKMGQKIADNPAPVSAPIHATVSGKVIAIEPRPHPLGDMIPAIVIENDFQDTPCTDLAPLTPEQMKDPEAILDRIREKTAPNILNKKIIIAITRLFTPIRFIKRCRSNPCVKRKKEKIPTSIARLLFII